MTSRSQQVASLLRVVPHAASRSQDSSIFDVGIRLSDSKILTLRTELPIDFPRVAPILRILDPGATHQWLDSYGRVAGLADLYNWDERTSDLGAVVQKALTEFCTRPPHINPALIAANKAQSSWTQTLPPPAQQNRPAPVPPSGGSSASNGAASSRSDASQQIQLSIPQSFPELDNMDQKQLQELLENDQVFANFFKSLSVVSNAIQLRDSLRSGNTEKATENVKLSKELSDLQVNIESLGMAVNDARQNFNQLLAQQRTMTSPLEPRKLAEGLEGLARNSDEESEDLARKMFDDPMALEANLARFRAHRVQYHLRKAKAERCRAQFT